MLTAKMPPQLEIVQARERKMNSIRARHFERIRDQRMIWTPAALQIKWRDNVPVRSAPVADEVA